MLLTTLRTLLPLPRAPPMRTVCKSTSSLSCAWHAAAGVWKDLKSGGSLSLSALHEEGRLG